MNRSLIRFRRTALVLIIVGAAAVARGADPASLVPSNTLVYLGWSDQDETCPLLTLADAIVHAPLVTQEMGDDTAAVQKGLAVVQLCAQHNGALVLLGPQIDEGQVLSQLGLVVVAGPAAPSVSEAFGTWIETLIESPDSIGSTTIDGVPFKQAALPNNQKLLWLVHQDHFLAAGNEAAARQLLARLGGHGEGLADNPEFRLGQSRVQPATTGGMVTLYADLTMLIAAFQRSQATTQPASEPSGDMVAALGLDAFKSAFLQFDRISGQTRITSFVHVEGARGLASLYKQEPLTDDDLRVVPQDAFWAVVCKLDLAKLWQEALRVLEQLKPDAIPAVEGGVAFAAQFLGFSPIDDLLPALGDTWAVYDSPSNGGLLITGIVAVGEIRDTEAVHRMLTGLVERVRPLAASNDIRLEQKELHDGAHTVHYVLVGGYPIPVTLAWGFVGDRCVIGLFPQTVAVALRQVDPQTRGPSLLDHPDYKAARSMLPEKLTSVGYADTRQSYRSWYALKQLIWTAVASLSAGTPQAIDLGAIPIFPEEFKGVHNSVWGQGPDEHGVVYRGVGNSAATLLIGGDVSSVTSIALATSILLPSLSRAREIAKRTASGANLQGIGHACVAYALDHGDRYPPDLDALVSADLISEKMLHSPRDELEGVSYVYIAGQTIHTEVTHVLAYERLTGDEGTNVLFIDGRVEWMKPDDFRRVLRETYDRLNRAADLPKQFRE